MSSCDVCTAKGELVFWCGPSAAFKPVLFKSPMITTAETATTRTGSKARIARNRNQCRGSYTCTHTATCQHACTLPRGTCMPRTALHPMAALPHFWAELRRTSKRQRSPPRSSFSSFGSRPGPGPGEVEAEAVYRDYHGLPTKNMTSIHP